MDVYEDVHIKDVKEHYHLGSNEYNTPNNQHKIFKKILELLQEQLPENLRLRFNSENSVNIVDSDNKSYLFLNLYYYKNQKYRVKIIPYERKFFDSFFKPCILKEVKKNDFNTKRY